jgi:tetratricopeptide (TPR) repeat protein
MRQLEEGIAAARSGDLELARSLLTNLLLEDETNERAWLWLSGVVETLEERQECLENALAINPANQLARRGLARLERERTRFGRATSEVAGPTAPAMVEAPASRQAEGGEFIAAATAVSPRIADSRFDDVWSTEEDICAYCATPIDPDDKRCRECGRPAEKIEYRYPATAILHVFWAVLVALSIVLLFQAIYRWRIEQNDVAAILHVSSAGALLLLVVGIYFRRSAAHIASVFVLVLVMILSVANFFTPFDPGELDGSGTDVALFGAAISLLERLGLFLKVTQGVIAGISLYYALFRVAPEFDRVRKRMVARINRGLNTAADYHLVARRMVQDGKWASAVLHWQRAAAVEPNNVVFQRSLAKAYIQLGFYARGMSVLETAQHLPMQPGTRAELERLLRWVKQRVESPAEVVADRDNGR